MGLGWRDDLPSSIRREGQHIPDSANLYTKAFFHIIKDGSATSAAVVVPLVMDLARPKSVIDVGCGTGTWLAAFRSEGVEKILGVDGEYVDRDSLVIPSDSFISADLSGGLDLGGTFDLCMSLEVAEHLPAAAASRFVESLTRLSPVVLFSAAVPGQTGVGHINERWPDYWMSLFAGHGYVQLDPFRHQLWHDSRVEWWYRQNLFLYVKPEHGKALALYTDDLLSRTTAGRSLLLLHSDIVGRLETRINQQQSLITHLGTGRAALRMLARAATRTLRRWFTPWSRHTSSDR